MRLTALVIIGLALVAVGALFARWLGRLLAAARLAARRRQGRRGEQAAPAVLARAGYRILEEQPELSSPLEVDGRAEAFTVRADFLVERAGARYVAEVKTGAKATDPTYNNTRRQLLEYRVLYDVRGVVLVDMEAEAVRVVKWPALEGRAPSRPGQARALLITLGIGFALGLVLGMWLARS